MFEAFHKTFKAFEHHPPPLQQDSLLILPSFIFFALLTTNLNLWALSQDESSQVPLDSFYQQVTLESFSRLTHPSRMQDHPINQNSQFIGFVKVTKKFELIQNHSIRKQNDSIINSQSSHEQHFTTSIGRIANVVRIKLKTTITNAVRWRWYTRFFLQPFYKYL